MNDDYDFGDEFDSWLDEVESSQPSPDSPEFWDHYQEVCKPGWMKTNHDPFTAAHEHEQREQARFDEQAERAIARDARRRDMDETQAYRRLGRQMERDDGHDEWHEQEERMQPATPGPLEEPEHLILTDEDLAHLHSLDDRVCNTPVGKMDELASSLNNDPVLKKFGVNVIGHDIEPIARTRESFESMARQNAWQENFSRDVEYLKRKGKEQFKKDFEEAVGSMDEFGETMDAIGNIAKAATVSGPVTWNDNGYHAQGEYDDMYQGDDEEEDEVDDDEW